MGSCPSSFVANSIDDSFIDTDGVVSPFLVTLIPSLSIVVFTPTCSVVVCLPTRTSFSTPNVAPSFDKVIFVLVLSFGSSSEVIDLIFVNSLAKPTSISPVVLSTLTAIFFVSYLVSNDVSPIEFDLLILIVSPKNLVALPVLPANVIPLLAKNCKSLNVTTLLSSASVYFEFSVASLLISFSVTSLLYFLSAFLSSLNPKALATLPNVIGLVVLPVASTNLNSGFSTP